LKKLSKWLSGLQIRRWFSRPRTAGILLLLILLFAYFLFRPQKEILQDVPGSTAFLSRQGELLNLTLAEDQQYRLITPLEDFPSEFIRAVMLYEDRLFYFHPGVNPATLLKAFWHTYIIKSRKIGGSTITMQTARLLYGLDSSTLAGKVNQIFHAFYLELYYSKKDILEAYLNLVPCGHNITGYPAAALIYFESHLNQLHLTEILTLAVLPQDPNNRAPDVHRESREQQIAKERLADLWIKKYPGYASRAGILKAPLRVEQFRPFRAPHFTRMLGTPGRTGVVDTTLDWNMQKDISLILDRYLERKQGQGVKNASIMVMDSQSLEVLVHIGSADFFDDEIEGQVDGTLARRSPGSTLKPFIYALAMDQGLIHPKTLLMDAPISFSEYAPDNYRSEFVGVAKADYALTTSRNIPAITLASRLDPEHDLYHLLKDAGVEEMKDYDHYGLSLVLGSLEVSMEELMEMYAALVNGGHHQEIRRTIDDPYISTGQLFSPAAAFMVLDILMGNPAPEKGLEPRHKAAYKTGTSIGFRDCWSIGIMGDYVVAVWMGNFDGQENHHFLGRRMAAPLLFEIFQELDSRESSRTWPPRPVPGLRSIEVCSVSGGIPLDICPDRETTWFIPGVSPIDRCDVHREIFLTLEGLRTERFSPDHYQTVVWEFWPSNVMELFAQAGLPRRSPPPYADDISRISNEGRAPFILFPSEGVEYHLPSSGENREIPFQASADSDVKLLYWFVDNRFLGTSEPGEILKMNLDGGSYHVMVVDDKGRNSRERSLEVLNYIP